MLGPSKIFNGAIRGDSVAILVLLVGVQRSPLLRGSSRDLGAIWGDRITIWALPGESSARPCCADHHESSEQSGATVLQSGRSSGNPAECHATRTTTRPRGNAGRRCRSLGSPWGSWGLIFAAWASLGCPRGVLGRSLGVSGGSSGGPGASLVCRWGVREVPGRLLGGPGGS